jgi:hypothetical protein
VSWLHLGQARAVGSQRYPWDPGPSTVTFGGKRDSVDGMSA